MGYHRRPSNRTEEQGMAKADDRAITPILAIPQLSEGLNKLTLGQLYYASWCGLPLNERHPRTKTGLAKALSVDRTTLYAWDRNPQIVECIKTLGRRFGEAAFGKVMGAVIKGALEGSAVHARLYFELLGEIPRASAGGSAGGEPLLPPGGASAGGDTNIYLGPTVVDSRRVELKDDPFAEFLQHQRRRQPDGDKPD